MIKRRFLDFYPTFFSFPHAASSFRSCHAKHYSIQHRFSTLPPSFSMLTHFPQILAPHLPLTPMPPSLPLLSSDPPPPVLQFTSAHSVFAPTIMSFLQFPLSLLTLTLPSPPLPLLLSITPTAESQILTVKDSFNLLDSFYPPPLFSHFNTVEIIWGTLSGPKNIQFTERFLVSELETVTYIRHGSDYKLCGVRCCVLFLSEHCSFVLLLFGKHIFLNSLCCSAYLQ